MTKEEAEEGLKKAGWIIETYNHLAEGGKVLIEMSEEKANLRLEKAKWLLEMCQHLIDGGEIGLYSHTYKIDGMVDDTFNLTMDSNTNMWHKKPLNGNGEQ